MVSGAFILLDRVAGVAYRHARRECRMKRPTGVTIVAVLGFIAAALWTVAGLAICMGGAMVSRLAQTPMGRLAGMGGTLLGVMALGVAALGIVTAIGLLNLRNWARIVAIAAAGLSLLVAALGLLDALAHVHVLFFFGAFVRRALMAAVEVWILAYLLQPSVKQAFDAKSP
jgi:hypothetical protein